MTRASACLSFPALRSLDSYHLKTEVGNWNVLSILHNVNVKIGKYNKLLIMSNFSSNIRSQLQILSLTVIKLGGAAS